MSIPLDDTVLEMLEDTEFSRVEEDNLLIYSNQAGDYQQKAVFSFSKEYPSSEEAAIAEFIIDFYLACQSKGTESYPSQDELTRAFWGSRMRSPQISTRRSQDKLYLGMTLSFPSGEKGPEALAKIEPVVQELLISPLVKSETKGKEIFEQVREERIRSKLDSLGNHSQRANTLFLERYFPDVRPMDIEQQLFLLKNASLENLTDTYEGLLADSFPMALFSGNSPLEEVIPFIEPFAQKLGGSGEESLLKKPRILTLEDVSGPVTEYGPSEQMQFLRAYPLTEVPHSPEERAAVSLVNDILGGEFTSRLMQIVREKHHLVYGIYSSFKKNQNLILIRTEHDPMHYAKIDELTQDIVEDVASGNISDEEVLQFQKRSLETMIVSGRDLVTCDQPSFRISNAFNQYLIRDRDIPLAERYKTLGNLEPEDVRRAARRYLDPEKNQVFTYVSGGDEE